jgi:Cytochrome P450
VDVGSIARSGLNSLPGVQLAPPTGALPSASALDNARLNALVVVPNALQGLFRRRRRAVAAATAADVDRWAVGLLSGMRRTHGGKPIWVRLVTSPALLLLSVEDIRTALEGSPDPFAPDPEAKRKGMSHFQPQALTISRGEDWAERRRFAESVLDTGEKAHRLSDEFAVVLAEEAEALVESVDAADGELDWERFSLAVRRATRRIVLGETARDDEELSTVLAQMMDAANSLPDEPSPQLDPFLARIGGYIRRAEPGSLVSLFTEAPLGERVHPVRQVTHWLFAMGDTLAINAYRALAAIVSHPDHLTLVEDELAGGTLDAAHIARLTHLNGCLEEAMRLWPTTPMLARELTAEATLGDVAIPAGTQVVIVNTFMHRDPDRHPDGDRFSPRAWQDDTRDDWSLNHFSHGPQGCPGAVLAKFAGKGLLGGILRHRQVTITSGALDPERPMPHMLDFFALRFALAAPG